jgi:hypothetical protein
MSRKRITKSSRKSQKVSTEYAILGILALAIVFVLFRGKASEPTRMAAEAPPLQESGKAQHVEVLSNSQPPVDVRKYQAELNRERASFAQARELGLNTMPLKNRGDTVTIPVAFVPEKVWCQGGDLDTMKYASKNDRAKDFLITLEGIDRGGKNPFVRVSLDQLYKGANFNFTIPRPKEATAYGLFICTDSRKENSCQRKSMQTHAQLSEQLAENPEKTRAEDRVFFFQNLVIDGRTVETYRTDNFSQDFQRSISGHLTKKGLSASEIQTAWKTNSTLKSAPVQMRKDRIVLSLPYNDPRCLQGKTR